MKTTILKEHLIKPALLVGKNISPKSQLPITQHILLLSHKGALTMTTTNTETTTSVTIPAKVEKEGGICVPSKTFLELVSSFPDEKIELSEEKNVLTVICGGYKAEIPGIAKEEFPASPKIKKEGKTLPKKDIDDALRSVLFSAATDEGRPLLTGIKIKGEKDGALFVATDGYRLSLKKTAIDLPLDFDKVIPGRALFQVMGMSDGKEDVSISQTEDGQLGFFIGDAEVYTRTIEGEYPAYEKIIPKTSTTSVTLDKEQFLHAVKAAAIFARDNANIIKLHIEKGRVVISANTPQVGEGKVDLEADTKGEDADIAFNSRFLLEFLNNFSGETFVFEMTGSLNPGAFKPVADDSYLHIIMPVRVQG